MLGIGSDIIEPSYYHLLGIEPGKCTAKAVDAALIQRKMELRQNIPGRQFVPMVLKFEKEQLEPAAQVLRNDETREEYDAELTRKVRKIKKNTRLIEKVRRVIIKAIGEDGTLDGAGRVALAEELRGIGIDEKNISKMLVRIPRAEAKADDDLGIYSEFFVGAVALAVSEGTLDRGERTKLLELAVKLNIEHSAAVATIERVAGSAGAKHKDRGADEVALVRPVFEEKERKRVKVKAAKAAAARAAERQEEIARAEADEDEGFDWWALLEKVAPIAAIVVFTIVVMLLSMSNKPRQERDEQQTEPAEQIEEVEDVRQREKKEADEERRLEVERAKAREQAAVIQQIYEQKQLEARISHAGRLLAENVVKDADVEDLLADAAAGMMVCCDRTEQFVSGKRLWTEPLRRLIVRRGRTEKMIEEARYIRFQEYRDVDEAVEGGRSEAWLKKMRADIVSGIKAARYSAIEQLRNDGSSEAIEVLLGGDDVGFERYRETMNRRLAALSEVKDTGIVRQLAERMGTSARAYSAHRIMAWLVEATGIQPEIGGRLLIRNELGERQRCSAWWVERISQWQQKQDALENMDEDPSLDGDGDGGTGGLLVELLADYCEKEAKILRGHKAEGDRVDGYRGNLQKGGNGEKLVAASGAIVAELERIVRSEADERKYLVMVDVAELERRVRLAASETALQKAAVNLGSVGEMLRVLAFVTDEKEQYHKALAEQVGEGVKRLEGVVNVADEIRVCSINNVNLWQLILQIKSKGS